LRGSDRFDYVNRLAQRGLKIHSYDGAILILQYDAAVDGGIEPGREVDENELILFGAAAFHDYPDAAKMFPGMRSIKVEARSAQSAAEGC
jgi:hypothetical protein